MWLIQESVDIHKMQFEFLYMRARVYNIYISTNTINNVTGL